MRRSNGSLAAALAEERFGRRGAALLQFQFAPLPQRFAVAGELAEDAVEEFRSLLRAAQAAVAAGQAEAHRRQVRRLLGELLVLSERLIRGAGDE